MLKKRPADGAGSKTRIKPISLEKARSLYLGSTRPSTTLFKYMTFVHIIRLGDAVKRPASGSRGCLTPRPSNTNMWFGSKRVRPIAYPRLRQAGRCQPTLAQAGIDAPVRLLYTRSRAHIVEYRSFMPSQKPTTPNSPQPSKEQVRLWLQNRRRDAGPPPSPDEIRRALGWRREAIKTR